MKWCKTTMLRELSSFSRVISSVATLAGFLDDANLKLCHSVPPNYSHTLDVKVHTVQYFISEAKNKDESHSLQSNKNQKQFSPIWWISDADMSSYQRRILNLVCMKDSLLGTFWASNLFQAMHRRCMMRN